MDNIVKSLNSKLEEKSQEMMAWKTKYNIKTAEEAEALRKQMSATAGAGAGAGAGAAK